ncbi:hypothetical protein BCR35DRAFT_261935 [Leucosporidium creatinivorum]|uniref:Zn(2)-C6 fungal-type domain-containing protein n=1 Tax=Leucosporidium creatinivorum TaxID=106004 RepID=A0A1Y2G071_9BASI|nr:hypothetical protein BCR35DRAFT_261935 [Leucosporidium creatinivorum]
MGDGAASEEGSSYSRGGRPRKRPKAVGGGDPSGVSWEGDSSGGEGGGGLNKGRKRANSKAKGKGKRKAEGDTEDDKDEAEGGAAGAAAKKTKVKQRKAPGDKKKKAGRACAACQKAHLTCDDARPCARCIKKGCPETCHDGTRKKAKYLMEIPDELALDTPGVGASGSSISLTLPLPSNPLSPRTESPTSLLQDTTQPAPFTFDNLPYYDTSTFSATNEFGSEAANLEYAILSSMLNGNGFAVDTYSTNSTDPRLNGAGNGNTMLINSPLGGGGEGGGGLNLGGGGQGGSNGQQFLSSFRPGASTATSPAQGAFNMSPPRLDAVQSLFPVSEGGGGKEGENGSSGYGGGGVQGSSAGAGGDLFGAESFGGTASGSQPAQSAVNGGQMTGEEAYRSVTKPYPYAQSYHYLVKHLKERFEKNDILRIIRALATYRPSLIALQMPLTEEDEIFVERTFQRTLVELNKLISFSGTPTVVWRRTGEICLVGTEFCLLTGWSREELLGKKYIFELLDTVSVVDLYEAFAKHAFESTSSSVTMQCVVLGPTGRPVPCAFCFSIRRDLFSCPSLVVGSFLPILT